MILKGFFAVTGMLASFCMISCNRNSVTDSQDASGISDKTQNITFSKDTLYLMVGEQYQAETVIYPDTTDISDVKWGVYNPQVASIDGSGKIEGLSCGTTQVVVSCNQVKKEMKVVVRALEKNKLRIHFRTAENSAASYKEYGIYLSGYAIPGFGGEGDAYVINDTLYDFRHLLQFQNKDSFGMYTDIVVHDDKDLHAAVLTNSAGFNHFTDASLVQEIDLLSYNEVWFIEGGSTLFISEPTAGLNQLRITGDSRTIKVGGKTDLKAALISSVTPVPGLTWQSSNQNIVTVDNQGIVTGVSPGTGVIMAMAGGLVAQKQVIIVPQIDDNHVRIHYCCFNNDYQKWFVESAGKSYTIDNIDVFGSYVDIPSKKGIPFTFSIRAEFQTAVEYTDNSGTKRELWVVQGRSEVTDTVPDMDKGALKIVNSWSDQTYQFGNDWEHVKDGSFYMTYDALKKGSSFAYFLAPKKAYQPRVIAVFQIESNFRGDFSICFGVGDTAAPRKIKRFLNYPNLTYGGYYTTFPASEIVFDLTEFLPLNNEDLFMQIDDGSSNRSLKVNKFSVEIYNDYSSSPVQTLNDTTLPALTKDGSTSRFILKNLTVAANVPLTKMAANGYEIASRLLTSDDLESYISCPARMPKEKFQRLVSENNIKILDRVLLSSSKLGKINAAAAVDNSKSVYFPPIGSQEQKGSCTAWALGYYLATYNMAKEKGWDLSGARWINGEITEGYKDKIMSPDFLYNLINEGKDNGSFAYDAVLALCDIGIASMNTAPIIYGSVNNWPGVKAFREAPLNRHDQSTIFYCNIRTDKDIENIKALLKAGELVTLAIQASGMVLSDNDTYTSKNAGQALDHMVTVVGFDDKWTTDSTE